MHFLTSVFLYSQLANLVNSPVSLAWALALRPSTTSPMRRNAVANRPLLEWILISPSLLFVDLIRRRSSPCEDVPQASANQRRGAAPALVGSEIRRR